MQLDGLKVDWHPLHACISEFNSQLRTLQSSSSVSASIQTKAKNLLNDVCTQTQALVEEKTNSKKGKKDKKVEAAAGAGRDGGAVEEGTAIAKQKKPKASALDTLEQQYIDAQAQAHADAGAKTVKRKKSETEESVDSNQSQDRTALKGTGTDSRWFAKPTAGEDGEDDGDIGNATKKSKKERREKGKKL